MISGCRRYQFQNDCRLYSLLHAHCNIVLFLLSGDQSCGPFRLIAFTRPNAISLISSTCPSSLLCLLSGASPSPSMSIARVRSTGRRGQQTRNLVNSQQSRVHASCAAAATDTFDMLDIRPKRRYRKCLNARAQSHMDTNLHTQVYVEYHNTCSLPIPI